MTMDVLSDPQIEERLRDVPRWRRGEGAAIVLEFELASFAAAIALVERVAEAAEQANHHPDILVHGWNKLRLTLSTHSAGGLTDADFALARQIERLV
jgi:4a-hydroxytetrahydrobiopterin dehydratase